MGTWSSARDQVGTPRNSLRLNRLRYRVTTWWSSPWGRGAHFWPTTLTKRVHAPMLSSGLLTRVATFFSRSQALLGNAALEALLPLATFTTAGPARQAELAAERSQAELGNEGTPATVARKKWQSRKEFLDDSPAICCGGDRARARSRVTARIAVLWRALPLQTGASAL